jgi:hypothetical protein
MDFASSGLQVYAFQRLFLVWNGSSNNLAKLAAPAPLAKIANFANNRCGSSLTPPMILNECAEIEDIFAITFGNFAN